MDANLGWTERVSFVNLLFNVGLDGVQQSVDVSIRIIVLKRHLIKTERFLLAKACLGWGESLSRRLSRFVAITEIDLFNSFIFYGAILVEKLVHVANTVEDDHCCKFHTASSS